ncbi:MAG: type IV pilin protein [Pseudomonadota bacterium]
MIDSLDAASRAAAARKPWCCAVTPCSLLRHIHMPSNARRGYTLIEVLIVVVIIGVLAAIAIPKFSETKRKAQVAAMKSALRRARVEAESYFAVNNTYVGLPLISTPPVGLGINQASVDFVLIEAWHSALGAFVRCRVYLGAADVWMSGDDGTVLREGEIGGNTCK